MESPITVVGAGNWGTTLACLLGAKEYPVRLWDRDPERALDMEMRRENLRYLAGIQLPISISVGSDLSTLMLGSRVVILAIPVPAIRAFVRKHRHLFSRSQFLVSASKGLDQGSRMTVCEILVDELGEEFAGSVGALSGPNLAPEIAVRSPSSSVVASRSSELCATLQRCLSTDSFRVYTSADLVGVEVGGALKNVIAIAAGILDELALGDNAKGAMLTRGLAEITRFGVHRGARPMTFLGLSGMGDLVTTCCSRISRNHTVGRLVARGLDLPRIRMQMNMVAEGIETTRSIHDLCAETDFEMPITSQVYSVLFEGKDPRVAIRDLMLRELKSEDLE